MLRQEAVQEEDPGPDVELGVEDVGFAHQVAEGGGEELHQAAGVGQADGLRVAPEFGGDHGQDQLHAEQRIDLPLAAQGLQLGLHHRLPAVDAGAEGPGRTGPGDRHRVLAQRAREAGRAVGVGAGRRGAGRRGAAPGALPPPRRLLLGSARLRHRPAPPGPRHLGLLRGRVSQVRDPPASEAGSSTAPAVAVGEHQVERWARW